MALFVLLEHDHPVLHWDLMLEVGEVLWTWRLPAPLDVAGTLMAKRTFDHRRVYLEYEGAISGNRGRVQRLDRGSFEWDIRESDRLIVTLHGQRLAGVLQLDCLGGEDWRAEWRISGTG